MSIQRDLIQSAKYKILQKEYQRKSTQSIDNLKYLHQGEVPKLSTHSKADIKRIIDSGYFDSKWYLEKYKDVEYSGMLPVVHYYLFGLILMRDPGPDFSIKTYIEQNTDYGESDEHPLIHFLSNTNEQKKVT